MIGKYGVRESVLAPSLQRRQKDQWLSTPMMLRWVIWDLLFDGESGKASLQRVSRTRRRAGPIRLL